MNQMFSSLFINHSFDRLEKKMNERKEQKKQGRTKLFEKYYEIVYEIQLFSFLL